MLRGRNFKENIKMFGKVEKYRLKMVGPLMYLSLCEGRPPPRLICRLPDSCLATGGHCRSEAAVIISASSRHHLILIVIISSLHYHTTTRVVLDTDTQLHCTDQSEAIVVSVSTP